MGMNAQEQKTHTNVTRELRGRVEELEIRASELERLLSELTTSTSDRFAGVRATAEEDAKHIENTQDGLSHLSRWLSDLRLEVVPAVVLLASTRETLYSFTHRTLGRRLRWLFTGR